MIYHGRALATFNASRAVAIVAGAAAFGILFWLFLLACSVGLAS